MPLIPLELADVYFAERRGLVKIGCSRDPQKRAEALRATLLAVIPRVGHRGERALHEAFAEYRLEGEWFQSSWQLDRVIAEAQHDRYPEWPAGDPMGDLFRAHRMAAGLSVREAARRVGVTGATILRWERGATRPGISDAAMFARVCGCRVSSFFPSQAEVA